eukprot:gene18295-4899_t
MKGSGAPTVHPPQGDVPRRAARAVYLWMWVAARRARDAGEDVGAGVHAAAPPAVATWAGAPSVVEYAPNPLLLENSFDEMMTFK